MSITKLILEIYNNIIKINNKKVIILLDKSKNLWFSLPHLLQALEYSTYRDEIKSINTILDNDDISTFSNIIKTSNSKSNINNDIKIHPHTKMISEGGLYLLLNKSTKPLAIELKNELYTKILPDIRKYGKFEVNKSDKSKLENINAKILKQSSKIKNLKYELKRTMKQSHTNNTGNGFIYILKVKTIQNGVEKICHKIGYTSNIEKRLATYKTGNPDVELVHSENLHCNKKQLETCVVNLNILKLLKAKTEVICDVPLKKILEELEDCKALLDKHKLN